MDTIQHCPEVFILPRGWIAFKFLEVVDSASILSGSWRWEGSGLLLKRWTPLFDPRTERYDTLPIWVKIPNLLFEYWPLDFFKLVGNSLGTFLEADLSFLHSGVCCLGKILVLIDISKGLVAVLLISKGNSSFKQPLDYVGKKLKCIKCH